MSALAGSLARRSVGHCHREHHLIFPFINRKWLRHPTCRLIEGDTVGRPFWFTVTLHRGRCSLSKFSQMFFSHPHGHWNTATQSSDSPTKYTMRGFTISGSSLTCSTRQRRPRGNLAHAAFSRRMNRLIFIRNGNPRRVLCRHALQSAGERGTARHRHHFRRCR